MTLTPLGLMMPIWASTFEPPEMSNSVMLEPLKSERSMVTSSNSTRVSGPVILNSLLTLPVSLMVSPLKVQ